MTGPISPRSPRPRSQSNVDENDFDAIDRRTRKMLSPRSSDSISSAAEASRQFGKQLRQAMTMTQAANPKPAQSSSSLSSAPSSSESEVTFDECLARIKKAYRELEHPPLISEPREKLEIQGTIVAVGIFKHQLETACTYCDSDECHLNIAKMYLEKLYRICDLFLKQYEPTKISLSPLEPVTPRKRSVSVVTSLEESEKNARLMQQNELIKKYLQEISRLDQDYQKYVDIDTAIEKLDLSEKEKKKIKNFRDHLLTMAAMGTMDLGITDVKMVLAQRRFLAFIQICQSFLKEHERREREKKASLSASSQTPRSPKNSDDFPKGYVDQILELIAQYHEPQKPKEDPTSARKRGSESKECSSPNALQRLLTWLSPRKP